KWQSCSSCHPDARVDGLNWNLLNDGIGNPKNTRSMLFTHRMPPVTWTGVRPSTEHAIRNGLRHIQFTEPDEDIANAIGAYLRSLTPVPGPRTDEPAIERGRKLFFSASVGCVACHPPPLYTDNKLHDTGTHGPLDFTTGHNRERVPQREFKTPTLIEVWRTAPYLHDGRSATIKEVITEGNHRDRRGKTSHLSKDQVADLVHFIRSL
ncbi:MAG: cell surface protein, partial [bacterium]|nr:cell surface protein [bacterium]